MMGLPFPSRKARSRIWSSPSALLLVAAASAGLAHPAHAQNVSAIYTIAGGLFNYNFTVQNPTAFTLADVNVSFPTSATGTNLSAPSGFQTTFDGAGNGPNMGIVDFSTTTGAKDFFAGTTTSGFLVTSNKQLAGSPFMTLDVNGLSHTGTLTTSLSTVPEPGALAFLAFGMTPIALAFVSTRRSVVAASLKG